jgi:hypothetical protein
MADLVFSAGAALDMGGRETIENEEWETLDDSSKSGVRDDYCSYEQ